ncbi:MAG: DNA methyltransferase, partial [Pirellulales bacterium]
TLFERSLDPTKRAQIGAHYTSREDILLIVDPVVLTPLRRRWQQVQGEVDQQLERRRKAKTAATRRKADDAISDILQGFGHELASVNILDPACGSGNFLYVAIQQLLSLEKEVVTYAARPEIGLGLLPHVRPTQLHGLEVNPYAAELAQVVIWIGYLQWMEGNGFNVPRDPILEPITSIESRDAILAWVDETGDPIPVWQEGARCTGPAAWPVSHCIIGNPPFLGSKLFRQHGLPDEYVEAMYDQYDIPNTSDLCCYWFEKARYMLEWSQRQFGEGPLGSGPMGGVPSDLRCGLLATQGIRGGANRKVLERIKQTGDIFLAWSDRDWVLDGAYVHVSIVGFDAKPADHPVLNGKTVDSINSDLSSGLKLREAKPLAENKRLAFMADTKGGPFEADWAKFRPLLATPNTHGKSNAQVMRPWVNGRDITQRPRGQWIIDFGVHLEHDEAAGFEAPFEYLLQHVYPIRKDNRRPVYAKHWWRHVEPRPAMLQQMQGLDRVLVTVITSKHRVFTWLNAATLPDHKLIVFTRSDDYLMGVLHSAVHEAWTRGTGGQVREVTSGFSYTPTSCFETFPLPWPPGQEPADHPAWRRISEAATALHEQRERWLNPPEWFKPIAEQVDAEDDFADVAAASGEEARRLIRESAIQARAAQDARLKKRTLTNLYNERPTWLKLAHEQLDRAVLAAYAATDPDGGWCEDWADVWKDAGAGQPLPEGHELAERRAGVEQQVLASLLRLNQERAAT